MSKTNPYTIPFNNIDLKDINQVGGKNASLGEMIKNLTEKGIRIPNGFAITSHAYNDFLEYNKIRDKLYQTLDGLDIKNFSNLNNISNKAKELFL